MQYIKLEFSDYDLDEAGAALLEFPTALVNVNVYNSSLRYIALDIVLYIEIDTYMYSGQDYYSVYEVPLYEVIPEITEQIQKMSDVNRDVVLTMIQHNKEQQDLINKITTWNKIKYQYD